MCCLHLLLLQLVLCLVRAPEGPVVYIHGGREPLGIAGGCWGHLNLLLLLVRLLLLRCCAMLVLVAPAVAGRLACRGLVGESCICMPSVFDCSSNV